MKKLYTWVVYSKDHMRRALIYFMSGIAAMFLAPQVVEAVVWRLTHDPETVIAMSGAVPGLGAGGQIGEVPDESIFGRTPYPDSSDGSTPIVRPDTSWATQAPEDKDDDGRLAPPIDFGTQPAPEPTTDPAPSTEDQDKEPEISDTDKELTVGTASMFAALYSNGEPAGSTTWQTNLAPLATGAMLATLEDTDPDDVPRGAVEDTDLTMHRGTSATVEVELSNGSTLVLQLLRDADWWLVDSLTVTGGE